MAQPLAFLLGIRDQLGNLVRRDAAAGAAAAARRIHPPEHAGGIASGHACDDGDAAQTGDDRSGGIKVFAFAGPVEAALSGSWHIGSACRSDCNDSLFGGYLAISATIVKRLLQFAQIAYCEHHYCEFRSPAHHPNMKMHEKMHEWIDRGLTRRGRSAAAELARVLGVSADKVSRMRKGERRPTAEELPLIEVFLGEKAPTRPPHPSTSAHEPGRVDHDSNIERSQWIARNLLGTPEAQQLLLHYMVFYASKIADCLERIVSLLERESESRGREDDHLTDVSDAKAPRERRPTRKD